MSNAWEVTDNTKYSYGHLPADRVGKWATHQADISALYREGKVPGVSFTIEGRVAKQEMLRRIRQTLENRSNFTDGEIEYRLVQINEHLEDPGLLENFQYFDIPSSDFMLQFYFAVWDRRIAEVMCYLHNYGKDLAGNVRHVESDDIWYQMSRFEGMNINERKKSASLVNFIKANQIKFATSFGGGNIPERLYGLPRNLRLTVFDDGPVSSLEELFPDAKQRQHVNYVHEPLSHAPAHQELLGTQQLVWMHGVSMYLDETKQREMTGAILCGASLLVPYGFMKYDYLIWTESMRRVINTQNWPYNPKRPMTIFHDVDAAIRQGMETLSVANAKLSGKAFMEVLDPEITLVEPWGVTSVRFTLQKHQ